MQVKSIRYRRSRTINTGNYESVRIEIGAQADVDPGEDPDEALDVLREQVVAQIHEEALAVRGTVVGETNDAGD